MTYILGITGNIACGKTAVGNMLIEMGVEKYIDADLLVHRLYEAGQPLAHTIVSTFGRSVMLTNGSINRKALGTIVFADPEKLKRLEGLVHPAVTEAVKHEISLASENGIVVIDAVKLLEGGSGALCHSKWLVVCEEAQEMARLMRRNGLSEAEARQRLAAQPDVAQRRLLVDEVIDNSATLEWTRQQVERAFLRFRQRFPSILLT